GRLLNALDGLAAWPDQEANLFRVNADRQEPRRPRANLLARIAQCRYDMTQDFAPAVPRLVQRRPDNLFIDAVDLEIELDAGDAADGAGHFEVHIAEMILIAHDVG